MFGVFKASTKSTHPIHGEALGAALEPLDAIADAFATEVATVARTIL